MTLRFADHLSLEAFALAREYKRLFPFPQPLLRKFGQDNVYEKTWYTIHRKVRRKLIIDAVSRYMLARHANGLLYPMDNGHGRSTSFAIEWDFAMAGRVNTIINGCFVNVVNEYDRPSDDPQVIAHNWNQLCEVMDAGNFEWDQVNQAQTCFKTGVLLYVEFENWRPFYGVAQDADPGVIRRVVRAPIITSS